MCVRPIKNNDKLPDMKDFSAHNLVSHVILFPTDIAIEAFVLLHNTIQA